MRQDSRPIPIGGAIQGVTLALGEPGREVAGEEETGELLILGPTVGPGYFGRPDLTEKVFFTHPETGLQGLPHRGPVLPEKRPLLLLRPGG